VKDIVDFEMQLRTAQAAGFRAGLLSAGGANGGPLAFQAILCRHQRLVPRQFSHQPVPHALQSGDLRPIQRLDRFTKSGVHEHRPGPDRFQHETDNITGVAGINGVLGVQPLPGSCGTCHDTPNVGDHSSSAPLNIGVGDLTSPLDVSYQRVITLQNNGTGTKVQTTDLGRADYWTMGGHSGPILRGLAAGDDIFTMARPPVWLTS
jgi:hypothetical protein